MIINRAVIGTFFLLFLFTVTSCKKYIEVDVPSTKITSDAAFASDVTAAAVLTDVYSSLSVGTLLSINFLGSLSSDELMPVSIAQNLGTTELYQNSINAYNSFPSGIPWNDAYLIIFNLNSAITGLEKSVSLTPEVKSQLLGEAKFIRAYCYFYLVNLYGDVPLVTDLDFEKNSVMARTPKFVVYDQIISDLLEAKAKLSENFMSANMTRTTERTRPTTWAASAMLSRVYLYLGSLGQVDAWSKAELEASRVINHTSLFDLSNTPLSSVFLKNSKEAIFQLQPVTNFINTYEGTRFLPNNGNISDAAFFISASLLDAFDSMDPRKAVWVGDITIGGTKHFYPFKYKIGPEWDPNLTSAAQLTEYSMILRLAEQYLIRAEARAKQNKIDGAEGAIADLNVIRTRARNTITGGLIPANYVDGLSQPVVVDHIATERRLELFCEMGDRWLNIKRTGTVDEVMRIAAIEKGGAWESYQQLYPIPVADRLKNPALTQNPGYQ